MNIGLDVYREVDLIVRKKEEEKKEGETGPKISSELMPAARKLDSTLDSLEHDLETLKNRMHESGLDREFRDLKSDLREKLSNFLSY